MDIFSIIFNGVKDWLTNRQKVKHIQAESKIRILEAQVEAEVNRINANTTADNDIDLVTVKGWNQTIKDDLIVYLFLIPLASATLIPILIVLKNGDYTNLLKYYRESYQTLDSMPIWYKYGLFAVIIVTLGLRSYGRKIIDKYIK